MTPVWSADGRSVAFVSVRDNTYGVYRRAADGSGAEERFYLHNDGGTIFLTDWSADGRLLTFWANERMYVMPLTGDRTGGGIAECARRAVLPRWPAAGVRRILPCTRQVPCLRGGSSIRRRLPRWPRR